MLKVGVLLGGRSIEREVSFNSGRTVCDHLDTNSFEVVPIFQRIDGALFILPWTFLYRGKISDFQHRLDEEAQKILWDDLPSLIDFMYIATHGQWAEDGRLQATLELFKIPYLGSKVFASAVAMNKVLHNDFLKGNNISVPNGFFLTPEQIISYDEILVREKIQELGLKFPLVVKPGQEGSSLGVSIVSSFDELKGSILGACYIAGDKGQAVLIEEKIIGMEFTCILITDPQTGNIISLPPTEIILQNEIDFFDYHQKYMPGMVNERTPAGCSAEEIKLIQETCLKAMKALEFSNMARIDGFLTKDGRIVIIDSNPLSGMGPTTFLFRQAAEIGMGHAELINTLIKAELENYKMTRIEKTVNIEKKLRVAVLFGGATHERETSLNSGRNVCYKLSPDKYEVLPVFVDSDMKLHILDNRLLVHTSTREIMDNIDRATSLLWSALKDCADFVFLALHGGMGENGVVQGWLEMLGMPYNGSSVFASALCMDKYKTGKFLRQKGFDTPNAYLQSFIDWSADATASLKKIQDNITFPCVVKPHDDGCSVMVTMVYTPEELALALDAIFLDKKHALIEEKLGGMELTVGVIGNDDVRALAPSEVVTKNDILSMEEKFLPGAGENQTPARLPGEDILFIQETIVKAFKALNCRGYARIDCFFQSAELSPTGQKRLVILECNTLPALTPATCLFHQGAEEGLRPMDLLAQIIELGLQEHKPYQTASIDIVLAKQEALINH